MPSSVKLTLLAAHFFSCLLAYLIAYLFICVLACLFPSSVASLLGYLLTCAFVCLIACFLVDLFASCLAYLPTFILAFRAFLPFLLSDILVFLLSCLPSCFLVPATCYLLPFSWNFATYPGLVGGWAGKVRYYTSSSRTFKELDNQLCLYFSGYIDGQQVLFSLGLS